MKIAIIGYGKMGKTIESLATAQGHEVVLKIDADNLEEFTSENLHKADVAIEFTSPNSAFVNISKCLSVGVPVVCGTTSWLDKLEEVKQIMTKNNTAFFYASNYSIGVNMTFATNKYLATLMNNFKDYNICIEEIHHTQKLDAPSGTGISLANQIIQKIERKHEWINSKTTIENQLSIISKRIDTAPGTHTVRYDSLIDTIELKHTAHSRKGFAQGAISAALFLIGKKGYFTMEQLLGF